MKFEKRVNKDGSSYYSFVWYDSKQDKRIRLTKEEISTRFGKQITTEEEARDCLKLLEAQYEAEKVRILRRLDWEKDYYNFNGILEEYEKNQKKKAPNSWQNNVFYIKHYVLPYFLTEKKLNNIELWSDYYDGFIDWLKTAKLIRGNRIISVSSANHAIKSLNTFLKHMFKQKLLHRYSPCESFPSHLTGSRTIDDVVYPAEMESVYNTLKANGHPQEATFFRYLFFAGMRLSEGLAISLADLYQGQLPETQMIAKKIKSHNMEYFGYIVSDSQLNEQGVRVPFKGKKEIGERYSRIIPIVDKVLWNDLVDLAALQYDKWKDSKHLNKKDFFLFDQLNDTTASRRLEEAYQSNQLKYRSWHCLRHSRATWLIGETGDEVLARAWLGHSSPKVFERYNHLYQSLVREAKATETVGKEFRLKRI